MDSQILGRCPEKMDDVTATREGEMSRRDQMVLASAAEGSRSEKNGNSWQKGLLKTSLRWRQSFIIFQK